MCYNNCQYERFNPVTGTCRCVRRANPCPEDREPRICTDCISWTPISKYGGHCEKLEVNLESVENAVDCEFYEEK